MNFQVNYAYSCRFELKPWLMSECRQIFKSFCGHLNRIFKFSIGQADNSTK